MHLLVTGGSGLVGWRVVEEAGEVADHLTYTFYNHEVAHPSADARELDVRDRAGVFEVIEAANPNVVVHTAAMTDVDACETNPQRAHEVNTIGTENVADACALAGADLMFVSTSFVFDGSEERYNCNDDRNSVNEYGHTKLAAERYVESCDVPSTIVRTDQPYGWPTEWQSVTMVQWVLQQLETTESVSVFDDWYNHPTYLPDLAAALVRIAQDDCRGTYHAVGPDYVSRYEWATHIAKVFGYDEDQIVPVSATDADIPATRPNARLNRDCLQTKVNIQMTNVINGLTEMQIHKPLIGFGSGNHT